MFTNAEYLSVFLKLHKTSIADPDPFDTNPACHFDTDPDPPFQLDTEPEPTL